MFVSESLTHEDDDPKNQALRHFNTIRLDKATYEEFIN